MNRPSLSACRAQKDNHGAQPSGKPKDAAPPKLPPSLEVLAKRFPLAFNLNDRKPLKIGIYKDILAAFADDSSFSNNALKKALRYYVTGRGYLLAMVNSTTRIDLEGNVAGEINPEDRLHAEKCLAVKCSNAPTTEP
ncbi:MAG: ProQ/FinO family protein [Alphaproteobacteria bacterium]